MISHHTLHLIPSVQSSIYLSVYTLFFSFLTVFFLFLCSSFPCFFLLFPHLLLFNIKRWILFSSFLPYVLFSFYLILFPFLSVSFDFQIFSSAPLLFSPVMPPCYFLPTFPLLLFFSLMSCKLKSGRWPQVSECVLMPAVRVCVCMHGYTHCVSVWVCMCALNHASSELCYP